MTPAAGARNPASARKSVVLPEPFGPLQQQRLAGPELQRKPIDDGSAGAAQDQIFSNELHSP